MSESEPSAPPAAPEPYPRLRDLDVLVGTWRVEGRDVVSGEAWTETVTRRWLPGGYCLQQQMRREGVDDEEGGEYIGYDSVADGLRSM
jgi:hypothetical protein